MSREYRNAQGQRIDRNGIPLPDKPELTFRERWGLFNEGVEHPGPSDIKLRWKVVGGITLALAGAGLLANHVADSGSDKPSPVVPVIETDYCVEADVLADQANTLGETDPEYIAQLQKYAALCAQQSQANTGLPGVIPTANSLQN